MNATSRIRPKDRDAVVQALRAGVVPRTGQHLIQVGRVREVQALLGDIARIADGGSGFRLVVGDYGAGKTFFLNLIRSIALEKKLVTAHADLNPDRRLQGSGGQGRSLYAELTKNISTRTRPEGGALGAIIEAFLNRVRTDARASGKTADDLIRERLATLSELVAGYDFAEVIAAYYHGAEQGNERLKSSAVRWLRGEYTTRTEARSALGVRTIVDDETIYDHLKLLARFVTLAGYAGMLVCLDEMVNLYKLANRQARDGNYEQVLRILNDSLQGSSQGLGFILGGTLEFLLDTRRGLYSYQALQSRLAENTYAARAGVVDFSGPVLRLSSLTHEDFFVLLQKLRHVFASGDPDRHLLPDDGLVAFMQHASQRLGEQYFRTPRTTITSFLNLLATIEQQPGLRWRDLLGCVEVEKDTGATGDRAPPDELASFTL